MEKTQLLITGWGCLILSYLLNNEWMRLTAIILATILFVIGLVYTLIDFKK